MGILINSDFVQQIVLRPSTMLYAEEVEESTEEASAAAVDDILYSTLVKEIGVLKSDIAA